MPSPTETTTSTTTTTTKKTLLIAYLEAEKVAAAARMRQCETFLASTVPLNDDEDDSDVRECLRSIASNAEEDFGTTLHLLTLLKSRTATTTKSSDAVGDKSLNCPLTPPNEVMATENISEHPSSSSRGADADACDIDPLFPGSDENHRREQAPEEDDESADLVPNLVTQKTGRFTHTTTRSVAAVASDDVRLVANLARSLPVSVPPPPGMERLSGEADDTEGAVDLPKAEELLQSEDIPASKDILASMQTIARSLHTNTNTLGDLPHSIHRVIMD